MPASHPLLPLRSRRAEPKNSNPARPRAWLATAVLALSALCLATSGRAAALIEFEPVDIEIAPVVPGSTVPCQITLTDGPADVVVYSDPPGVVSYEGTVGDAVATVEASVSSSAVPGTTVTVFLRTAGGHTEVAETITLSATPALASGASGASGRLSH